MPSKTKKSIPKALRMKLWGKEIGDTLSGTCYVCERELQIDNFQAGHIVSEANGGKITIDNLKVICKPCNTSCGTMNLVDFKAKFTSTKPKKMKKLTAYNVFFKEYQSKLKHIKDSKERVKEIGKRWKTLTNVEKQKYKDIAEGKVVQINDVSAKPEVTKTTPKQCKKYIGCMIGIKTDRFGKPIQNEEGYFMKSDMFGNTVYCDHLGNPIPNVKLIKKATDVKINFGAPIQKRSVNDVTIKF